MKIIITKNIELTPEIEDNLEKKMMPLAKLIKPFERNGERELRMEVGRITKRRSKGDMFSVVANLSLPGKVLRADESAEDLRSAIDLARDVLRREIEKYKTKVSKE